MGTTALLTGDVVSSRPIPIAGELNVGLVEPEPELLQRYAADFDRVEWWENRVTEIWNSCVSQEVKSWAKQ